MITVTSKERFLLSLVAVRMDYEPDGTCKAWVDARDELCGDTTDHLLCARHVQVAMRRAVKEKQRAEERREKALEKRAVDLPKWEHRLAQIDARIAVLDPPPPTADRAAWGGVIHPSLVRKQRTSSSDARVAELARLHRERDYLVARIGGTK